MFYADGTYNLTTRSQTWLHSMLRLIRLRPINDIGISWCNVASNTSWWGSAYNKAKHNRLLCGPWLVGLDVAATATGHSGWLVARHLCPLPELKMRERGLTGWNLQWAAAERYFAHARENGKLNFMVAGMHWNVYCPCPENSDGTSETENQSPMVAVDYCHRRVAECF